MIDAIAIANYFVEKNKKDKQSEKLTLLRLVKYVYIAYGFALVLLGRSTINDRFDKVEAWRYGPVIPSVYHSFKHFKNKVIDTVASILVMEDMDGTMTFENPKVNDSSVMAVLDLVWDRYKNVTTTSLIDILHKDGTPWKFCYKEGVNEEIPQEMTYVYYKKLVESLSNKHG